MPARPRIPPAPPTLPALTPARRSDWGATHSTVPAALAGLDQQMPDNSFFGANLSAAIAAGAVPQSRLDDMVLRM
jgi:beta-glucosidase